MQPVLLALVVLTGCGFEADAGGGPTPEPGTGAPDDPVALARGCAELVGDTGLVLCVDFEDLSLAERAVDASGRGNDLDLDAVGVVDRGVQQAAWLTRDATMIVDEDGDLELAAFTTEMWIAPADGLGAALFDKASRYAMARTSDGTIRCTVDGDAVTSVRAPAIGVWTHVACRYGGGELRLYIDGDVDACEQLDPPDDGPPVGATVGSRLTGGFDLGSRYAGGIDDLRVYDRAIDEAAVCSSANRSACATACPPR